MKNSAIISALILCCCAIFISCETDCGTRDNSLAGSISYYYYRATMEGTFDGVALTHHVDPQFSPGRECTLKKVSKTKVSFNCHYGWKTEEGKWRVFEITIPDLPISGKPYNVTFDYVSHKTSVMYDDNYVYDIDDPTYIDKENTKYRSVTTSINGWMKEVDIDQATTRMFHSPSYNCDITIECIIDGKKLNFRITGLKGY